MTPHPVLLRQLRRLGLSADAPPDAAGWAKLLTRVSNAYTEGDNERYLLERSQAIAHKEMRELYEEGAASERRQAGLRRLATAVAAGKEPAHVADLALHVVDSLLGEGTTLRWVTPDEVADPPQGLAPEIHGAITGGAPVWAGGPAAITVAVPVMVSGRVRGVLCATPPRRDDRTEHLLTDLADLVALSIVNGEATAQLTAHAATDALTGLANLRVFKDRMEGEVRRAFRHGRAMSLLVADVDEFKQVNDLHGHQVGDIVLVEVARRIAAVSRAHDLPARIGGEEFAVLLPETDGIGAHQLAERLRKSIADTHIEPVGRVTISVGVCALADAEGAHELMARADAALFWAKANGRNLSFRWTPETAAQLRAQDGDVSLERIRALTAVRSLARAVDDRDPFTRRHSDRVADLSHALALELGWTARRAAALRQAALVHDVGKVGLPQGALAEDTELRGEGADDLATHPELGARMVRELMDAEQVSWILAHHERPDGRGYPAGLTEDEIPDGALVLAVADAWDALTRGRQPEGGASVDDALHACNADAGTRLWAPGVAALARLREAGVLAELASGGGARTRSEVPWA
ncbi:MAG: diguanylate cyclase [Thermoleophilia bacterium]